MSDEYTTGPSYQDLFRSPNYTGIPRPVPTVRSEPREGHTEFHSEVAIPGVDLNNYTKKTPSEDGKYVTIVQHQEWIEKIKQPPTPEEIAEAKAEAEARKKADRIVGAVVGTIFLGFFGLVGIATWQDEKKRKAVEADIRDASK